MAEEPVPAPCECKKKRPAHFAWGPFFLTIVADAMIGFCLYNVFYGTIQPNNQRVADVLMGNVVIAWAAARAYWYSTTYGSQAKDKIIAQAEPVKPT